MRRIGNLLSGLVLLVPSTAAFAENWPGYEKDNLHQNSSAVDIDPAHLTFAWEHIFSNPVDCVTTNPASMVPAISVSSMENLR